MFYFIIITNKIEETVELTLNDFSIDPSLDQNVNIPSASYSPSTGNFMPNLISDPIKPFIVLKTVLDYIFKGTKKKLPLLPARAQK